jgi:hypothetical protein
VRTLAIWVALSSVVVSLVSQLKRPRAVPPPAPSR